jgi:ADP-heptose:LPS heptosyltransferase|tara:strand:- start:8539 stop:9501 length:963 start_codon:yes stop_codon:yes gene_type:complete
MKNIKKILLIKNDHMGDMIILTGVFRELRKNFPDAKIVLISSNVSYPIIEHNKNIDEILIMDHGKGFFKNIEKYPRIWRKIKQEKFDIVIDLRGDIVNIVFFMILTGIKSRLGFHNSFFSKLLLTSSEKRDLFKHNIKNVTTMIEGGLNINLNDAFPEIMITEKDIEESNQFINKNDLDKFICVCPDASLDSRIWSIKNFDELIKYINLKYPAYKVIIVGITDRVDELIKMNPDSIALKKANIRMLYHLFRRSSLVIALDTGTTPLAWAGRSKLINILLKISIPFKNYFKPLDKNALVVCQKKSELSTEEVTNNLDKFLA